ncbi:MAG: stage III sporulation protein AE [Lachnospiraceae bacterium]
MKRIAISRFFLQLLCFLFLCCTFLLISPAAADTIDDINDEMDYTELDSWLEENSSGGITFTEYVDGLLTGNEDFSVKGIAKSIIISCIHGVEEEFSVFSTMFLIMGMAAVFTAFTSAIKNVQVAEMGFYLTYMLTISVLSGVFSKMCLMAENLLGSVTEFMNLLTPAYIMGMAFSTGSGSATAMYEISLFVIALADNIILKLIFPMIDIYFMMIIANHVTGKGMFSKMTELIFTGIQWVNKTLIAVVIGLSTIQSLVAPGVDQLKRSVLTRASEMIPIIGNLVGGTAETVLGAGMVLKNVIGVAGVLAIGILCIVPISKIAIMQLAVRFSGAVVEPVVDGRLTDVISDTGKAIALLMETLITTGALFIFAIMILALGTGI